jgi:nitrite reductase (NADH) large subunit
VVNDRLELAAELEAEMQLVVDTYECEWKKAVTDPETRRRFRHFVNSEARDDTVTFVEERGQIRPATPRERQSRQFPIPVVAETA